MFNLRITFANGLIQSEVGFATEQDARAFAARAIGSRKGAKVKVIRS